MKAKVVRLAVVLAMIAALLITFGAPLFASTAADMSPPPVALPILTLALGLVAISTFVLTFRWTGRALVLVATLFTFTDGLTDGRLVAARHRAPRGPAVIAPALT